MAETPLHEMGHNFDSYKWTFEPEALAMFKIYYYFSQTNEKFMCRNNTTVFTGGSGYMTYIKSYANRYLGEIAYDDSIPYGVYSPYGLAYNLAKIQNTIGWEPFKQTFKSFHELSSTDVPTTNMGKFNLFLSYLKAYSGRDIISMLTAQEKKVYQNKLGGTIQYVSIPQLERQLYEQKIAETSNGSISINTIKSLQDFAGNKYTLIECSPKGYYIYHNGSGNFVEYSIKAISPYKNYSSSIYYLGIGNYYRLSGSTYLHIVGISEKDIPYSQRSLLLEASQETQTLLMANTDGYNIGFVTGNNVGASSLLASVNHVTTKYITQAAFFQNSKTGFGRYYPGTGPDGLVMVRIYYRNILIGTRLPQA